MWFVQGPAGEEGEKGNVGEKGDVGPKVSYSSMHHGRMELTHQYYLNVPCMHRITKCIRYLVFGISFKMYD